MPVARSPLTILLSVLAFVVPRGATATAATPRALVALRGRDEVGLRALLARQDDPADPDFARWLTPDDVGRRFGASSRDLRRVSRWLARTGCRVRRFPSRRLVACIGGDLPRIPSDLRRVVADVLDLARPVPLAIPLRASALDPLLLVNGVFALSPADFARLYGLDAIQAGGIDGSGRTIGVVAISQVDPAEVARFRTTFGLPPASLVQDGGVRMPGTPFEVEAMLDVTWSGAVAPGARVFLSGSSSPIDALARLVNRSDIDAISSSIDLCGRGRGVHKVVREVTRLFRQAKAQGTTVLFASGDSGAHCRPGFGLGVLASSPLVTAVGGTTPSPALDAQGNVTGYGTETVWNQSGGGQTPGASGGGPTSAPRPGYQHGGGRRTLPDVAFPAAVVYPLALDGAVRCCVGGTSAASPAWAGVVALLDQALGRRAGFLNPRLYQLGRAQAHGGAHVFHDITEGSNALPGERGFPARPGYDLATGWGSVDGSAFFQSFGAR